MTRLLQPPPLLPKLPTTTQLTWPERRAMAKPHLHPRQLKPPTPLRVVVGVSEDVDEGGGEASASPKSFEDAVAPAAKQDTQVYGALIPVFPWLQRATSKKIWCQKTK